MQMSIFAAKIDAARARPRVEAKLKICQYGAAIYRRDYKSDCQIFGTITSPARPMNGEEYRFRLQIDNTGSISLLCFRFA